MRLQSNLGKLFYTYFQTYFQVYMGNKDKEKSTQY